MQDKFHRFGWFNMFAAPDMTPHDEHSPTLKMPAMGCSPQRRFQETKRIPATDPPTQRFQGLTQSLRGLTQRFSGLIQRLLDPKFSRPALG
jgi:hypothetical protein